MKRFAVIFDTPVSVKAQNRFPEPYRLVDGDVIQLNDYPNCRLVCTVAEQNQYRLEFHHAKWFPHIVALFQYNADQKSSKFMGQIQYNGKAASINHAPIPPLTNTQRTELEHFVFFKLYIEENTPITIEGDFRTTHTYNVVDMTENGQLEISRTQREYEYTLRFDLFTRDVQSPPDTVKNENEQMEAEEVVSDNENHAIGDDNDLPLPWRVLERTDPLDVTFSFRSVRARHQFMAAINSYQSRLRRRLLRRTNLKTVQIPIHPIPDE